MAKKKDSLEDEIFSDDNKAESSWFKFEEIGDKVFGKVVSVEDAPGDGDFGPQRIFTLEEEDGSITKVGVAKKKKLVMDATRNLREGDLLGLKFVDEYQTEENKKKGFDPAKTIEAYVKETEEGDKNEEAESEFDKIANDA